MAKPRGKAPGKKYLPEEVKVFIVRALAAYDSPSEVAAAVRAEFSLEIDRRQVNAYNPERASGGDIGKKLMAEFERARAAFKASLEEIPEANRSVRVRMLAKAARRAEERQNHGLMASLLEQIAKETGEHYTNRREVKHSGKIETSEYTDEQLINRITRDLADLATGPGGGESQAPDARPKITH